MGYISNRLPRYHRRSGLTGLGYDPDAGYADTSGASDVGTSWVGASDVGASWGSSIQRDVVGLAKTYLQMEAQRKLAESLKTGIPGQVITANGVTSSTPPIVHAAPQKSIGDYLKDPLVLAGLGLGAFLLFKRKR